MFQLGHVKVRNWISLQKERQSECMHVLCVCVCVCVCVCMHMGDVAHLCVSLEKGRSGPFLCESLECVQLMVSLCLSANRSLVIIGPIQTPNTHLLYMVTHTQPQPSLGVQRAPETKHQSCSARESPITCRTRKESPICCANMEVLNTVDRSLVI